MLVARDIFKKPWDHPRVQLLCADLIDWMEKTRQCAHSRWPVGTDMQLPDLRSVCFALSW